MNSVLKAIVSPGDEILVPSPFFPEYTSYARNHCGILKPVPTKEDFSLDTEAIADAITPKTVAIIINSPNNPVGKIYSQNDINALAVILESARIKTGRTIVLIADEPYREIVYDNRKVAPVFPAWPASAIVSSFAKNLSLPGERIGYTAVNPACPDALTFIDAIIYSTRVLGYVNAPATFQRIVAECWNEPVDYSSYTSRRNHLTAILRNAGIDYSEPEGAFYLFCKVPPHLGNENTEPGDDILFCDHLKTYKILGVPGSGFGRKGWFRLAYCVSETSIIGSAEAFAKARADW